DRRRPPDPRRRRVLDRVPGGAPVPRRPRLPDLGGDEPDPAAGHRSPAPEMTAPLAALQGVRLLGFTQFLLRPSGDPFLADLGADVVKIEPTGGTLWERNWSGCDLYKNGVSVFFMSTHRNQRSLAVDLKHPDGQAIARKLIAGADILVQNFRPGVMERL